MEDILKFLGIEEKIDTVPDSAIDISGLLEKLHHEALTESLSGAQPVQKVASQPYTPTVTIKPADGSPLAKSYAEFVSAPTPARVEKEPCESGGTWVRHYDAAGKLFRVFLAPDELEGDEPEPVPAVPAKAAAIQYASVPTDLQKFLTIEG